MHFWHIWCIGRRSRPNALWLVFLVNSGVFMLWKKVQEAKNTDPSTTGQHWYLKFVICYFLFDDDERLTVLHIVYLLLLYGSLSLFFLSSRDVFSESFVFLRFWKVWMKANSGFWLRVDQRSQSWYFSLYLSAIINCIHISFIYIFNLHHQRSQCWHLLMYFSISLHHYKSSYTYLNYTTN